MSYGSFYGPSATNAVISQHSGTFNSFGDVIQPLPSFGIKVGDTGEATFNCLGSILGTTTDVGAPSIYVYSTSIFNTSISCRIQHASTGQIFGGLAGGLIQNSGTNIVPAGTLLAANTPSYVDLTGTFTGAGCTGVATASSTLGLYGTGPNVTLTTCTSTTIGNGIRINRPAKIYEMLVTNTAAGVNASSGVVTVLKNGATQTMTCTIGTATTGCSDSTAAHFVTLAIGDLVSLQFTTQAAETLAGVQVTLIIQ